MSKRTVVFFLALFTTAALFAQSSDPVILSYQRNFIRSSISTKADLLKDASRITTVSMIPLYSDALSFVAEKYAYLGNDDQLMDIAVIAAEKSAAYNDASIVPLIRSTFEKISDSRVRIACLNSFAVLAYKRPDDIAVLNAWFSQNLGTTGADTRTLAACATVLGKTDDASSFSVLFAASTGNYDSSIVTAAKNALNALDDGYADNILAIIEKKNVKDMCAAFSLAMKKETLSKPDKGRIAERAFAIASEIPAPDSGTDASLLGGLIRDSMAELTTLAWSQASPTVVKYFYTLQQGTAKNPGGIDDVIPAVKCLGAMGTVDAAQTLSIYLGILNSETEQKKTYNEQLLLVVIQALGDLGDKSAFDYLLYVGYLDYPETVKKASRDALARLAW